LVSLVLLAAALLSIRVQVQAERLSDPSYRLPDMLLVLVVTAAATLSLTARRRFPLVVLGVTAAALVVARLLDSPEDDIGFAAVLLAAYTAGAYGAMRRRSWVFAVVLGVLALDLARPFLPHLDEHGALLGLACELVFNVPILAVFWAFGVTIRARRENERELEVRAAELERQREENARRAVFDERVRIARELHDVVAHHVSVMGIQAGAARRVMVAHPEKAQDALTSIESASRHAVVELHKMLGFLRQEGEADELAPQPTLRELDELVEQVKQAKLRVEVRREGDPRPLPQTLEVSAYRLVQEALTNTLKHAGASNVTVHLRYRPEALDVEIVDDGRGDGDGSAVGTGGHGLIGMRERVAMHGGRLRVGPRPEGGFEVQATFPLDGSRP
ncbi:MAG: sensor histidine kinase, partial [Acidimicrobiales bacterium]